jgi:hypothetical protein
MSNRICQFVAAPLSVAASLVLIGCASGQSPASMPWRVEGIERITHGYQVAAQGAYALGEAKRGEGRWQEAADAYAKAVFADPTMAQGFEGLGLSQANLGRQQAAIAAFRRAVELRPGDLQFLNNLAYALIAAGQPADAVPYLQAALERDPSYERARRNLVRAETAIAQASGGTGVGVAVLATAAPATATPATAAPAMAVPPMAAPAIATPAMVAPEMATPARVSPAPPVLESHDSQALTQASSTPAVPTWVVTPVSVTAVSTSTPSPSPTASPNPAVSPGQQGPEPAKPMATAVSASTLSGPTSLDGRLRLDGVRVEVGNGNGVEGAAKRFADWLAQHGAHVTRLFNVPPYATGNSRLMHPPGRDEAAATVAQAVPGHAATASAQDLRVDLRVVVGKDLAAASTCGGQWPCPDLPRATAVAVDTSSPSPSPSTVASAAP